MINSKLNITVILNLIVLFLYGTVSGEGIVSYAIMMSLLILVLKKYFKNSFHAGLMTYSYVSMIGLLFITTYISAYGNTFSPHYDDSAYYYNSIYLSEFSLSLMPPTLFEVIMSAPIILFNKLGIQLRHIDLLPINWFVSSVNIMLLLKILEHYFKINKVPFYIALALLLNANFIDTSAHLFRDTFMIFFSLLCIQSLFGSKYKSAIFWAIFVFLIRGANGALMIYFILCFFLIRKYNFKFRTIVFGTLASALLVVALGNSISSSFFRGGFGVNSTDTSGILDRISDRSETFADFEQTGSSSLIHGKVYQKLLAPIIYTFTPFISPPLYKDVNVMQASYRNIFGYRLGTSSIFQIGFLLFMIHIIFISYLLPRIVYGFYIGFKNGSSEIRFIFFYIILAIVAITFISMQARHRLAFLMFFPFLLHYCEQYSSRKMKQNFNIISLALMSIFVLVNIYAHLF